MNSKRIENKGEYVMRKMPHFHGSDLEEIEKYYGIPKESIVGFGANVNPLGISETVRAEVTDHLDVIMTYPDRNYTSLKKVIGNYCHVRPEHVVVGNGSTELISMLIQHLKPRKALLVGPTYSEYEREIGLCGGEMVYYNLSPENEFQLDLDAFLDYLDDSIDLLIMCNPNNPTSSAVSATNIECILKKCVQHNIFVMVDETYVEFAPDIEEITCMPYVEHFKNIMVIRGVSKFYAAPGLRLGYGVTSNMAFIHLLKTHQNPWSLNSIGAYAGEIMLTDDEFIARTRALIDSERERIYKELESIPYLHTFRPVANFFLVKILKEDVTSFDVFDHLIRKGLMVRDCSSFQNLNGEYFRFCIMNPEDNTRLLDGLKEYFI